MRIVAAVLVVLITIASTPLIAQSPVSMGDWSRLSVISAGEELLVRLEGGKKVNGEFLSATDSVMQLLVKKNVASFDSVSVVQVCRRRPRRVGKTTILGAAAGAALGYVSVARSWNEGTSATQGAKALGTLVPLGAAVGTVVGFFLEIGRGAWEPIYEKQTNH